MNRICHSDVCAWKYIETRFFDCSRPYLFEFEFGRAWHPIKELPLRKLQKKQTGQEGLFAFYFGTFENSKRAGAEYILLIMAIVINSLSYFI